MKFSKPLLSLAAIGGITFLAVSAMQSPGQKPGAQPPANQGAAVDASMPKPMPEHAMLHKLVGTWDALITMTIPGMPAATSKGTSTYKAVGDLWVASDFTGEMMGAPFIGHGIDGYDSNKKKFVGTWVDSMTSEMLLLEGTHDAASKSTTMLGMARDMTGALVQHRMVSEMKDNDTFVFHMFVPGADGKESEVMRIDYKRKK